MRKKWKKMTALLLAASMVLSLQLSAFASEGDQVQQDDPMVKVQDAVVTPPSGEEPDTSAGRQDTEGTTPDPGTVPADDAVLPEGGAASGEADISVPVIPDEETAPVDEAAVPAADTGVSEYSETPAAAAEKADDVQPEAAEEGKEETGAAEVQEIAEAPETEADAETVQDEDTALPFADDRQAIYDSLSMNYTKLLPREFYRVVSINETDYRLNWEKIPVNFSVDNSDKNYYKPGEATIKQLNLSQIADIDKKNGKDLMMFVEYYDNNPQYDARTRGWDRVYTRIKKEGKNKTKGTITDPVAGSSGVSNSVSINVALVWMEISANGVPKIEEKPEIVQGVRVSTVVFKNGKNATLSSNGEWLPYAKKKSSYQDNSCFALQLSHVKKDSGLTAKQLRNINKALKWKKKDNEDTRFLFGVTKRELAGSGQYDKLTYKIRNGKIDTRKGKLEIKGVKIRIRFKNGGSDTEEGGSSSEVKNTYMNKYITVKLPPQKKITTKPAEDSIKYGAYIKEFDEDKLVVEGVGNFCGTAYWIRNSETGTFSME